MLSKITYLFVGVALASQILPSCQSRKSTDPTGFLSSYSGFQRHSKLDDKQIHKGDLGKITNFDKIYLEEILVLQPSDMGKKKITQEDLVKLQRTCKGALQSTIQNSNFSLASDRGPGTLSLRVAIVDISPGDPKLFVASMAPYASTASTAVGVVTGAKFGRGSAKIEAELIDSITRERIYCVIDENTGTKLKIIQGMTRWGHIELAVKQWAKGFGKFLDNPTN